MSEQEIQRAMCEHDYGDMCETHPFGGCVRTCIKCGQMVGSNTHCWERREQREQAAQRQGKTDT